MKTIKIFIIVLFCCKGVLSQDNKTSTSITPANRNVLADYSKSASSQELLVYNPPESVEGSPFLSNDWSYANIRLADNRTFDSVLIKLNLFDNKVHFKDDQGRERMIGAAVKQIVIKDASSKWNNALFVSGYGENNQEYYQVLTDGKKAGLLKKVNVIIKDTKNIYGIVTKSFELQNRFYIYSSGKLYKDGKDCSSLMAAFGNDDKIKTFISTQPLKCNRESDLLKLVEMYNSY